MDGRHNVRAVSLECGWAECQVGNVLRGRPGPVRDGDRVLVRRGVDPVGDPHVPEGLDVGAVREAVR